MRPSAAKARFWKPLDKDFGLCSYGYEVLSSSDQSTKIQVASTPVYNPSYSKALCLLAWAGSAGQAPEFSRLAIFDKYAALHSASLRTKRKPSPKSELKDMEAAKPLTHAAKVNRAPPKVPAVLADSFRTKDAWGWTFIPHCCEVHSWAHYGYMVRHPASLTPPVGLGERRLTMAVVVVRHSQLHKVLTITCMGRLGLHSCGRNWF